MSADTAGRPSLLTRAMFSRNRVARRLATHGFILLLIFAMLYPILWVVGASFSPVSEALGSLGFWPDTFTLENYREGWHGMGAIGFGQYFLNSAIVAALSIVGNLLSCALTAYAFARIEFPGKKILFSILLLTILLPNQITIVPQYVIFERIGWLNTYLPMIVPKFTAIDAFFTFLLIQFIRGIPNSLDAAAQIDGYGHFGIFFRIVLPLCLPALATVGIFTFIYSWNDFLSPLLYLSSPELYTVPVGLSQFMDATGRSQLGSLFAMAVLSLVPVVAVFATAQKLITEGISTVGVK